MRQFATDDPVRRVMQPSAPVTVDLVSLKGPTRKDLALGGLGLVGIATLEGLDNQAALDRFGRSLHTGRHTIDDGSDFLNVGLELALGLAGDLDTHATKILGFTAVSISITDLSFTTCKFTNAWHIKHPFRVKTKVFRRPK